MNVIKGPIEEYCIVKSFTCEDLTIDVNIFISQGWQPCGGMSYGVDKCYGYRFFQPMVKQKVLLCLPTEDSAEKLCHSCRNLFYKEGII